jgi:RNA polymerase sigma-70 factor, ECF subfamily
MSEAEPSAMTDSGSEQENCLRAYLDEIKKGNAQALGDLYDASAPMLYALALRILANAADAEEVLLDAFEQVWRTASSFDPARGGVWRWLVLLTRSRALDRLRSLAAKRLHENPGLSEFLDVSSSAVLPEQIVVRNQQQSFIRKALATLPLEQRRVLELAYFSGMTHTEMAALLGLPLGTIKTRVRIAMDKLRTELHPIIAGRASR